MKNNWTNTLGILLLAGSSYALGALIAGLASENERLKDQIKLAEVCVKAQSRVIDILNSKPDKEKVPEEKTEEWW